MGAMTKKSWVGAGAIDTSFSYIETVNGRLFLLS